MENLLSPTSIVGCSVSLLFCLGTVIVLGCYRNRTRPLLIKQQVAFAIMITNIVVLAGLQGAEHKVRCRIVTCFLHYGVISCFSWLCVDQHYILANAKGHEVRHSFLKIAGLAWAAPIPFVLIVPVLGLTSSRKFGSNIYDCWYSDHVIWSLILPCALMVLVSFYMILAATMSLLFGKWKSLIWMSRESKAVMISRKQEVTRYNLKTNFLMLLLTSTLWIFGNLILWHPKVLNYQLIFGLGNGLQGLFLFFFYCVFGLELDLYGSDRILVDGNDLLGSVLASPVKKAENSTSPSDAESVHPYVESKLNRPLEVNEVRGKEDNGTSVKKEADVRYDAREHSHIREDGVRPELADQIDGAGLRPRQLSSTMETRNTNAICLGRPLSHFSDITASEESTTSQTASSRVYSELSTGSSKTTALIHSQEVLPSERAFMNSEAPQKAPNSTTQPVQLVSNASFAPDDATGKAMESFETNHDLAERRDSTNLPSEVVASESADRHSPVASHAGDERKPSEGLSSFAGLLRSGQDSKRAHDPARPDSCEGSFKVTDSKSSLITKKKRKAVSTSSYATPMGMNELESLFNNADLMNQSMANYKPAAFNSYYSSKTNSRSRSSRSVDQLVSPTLQAEGEEEAQPQRESEKFS